MYRKHLITTGLLFTMLLVLYMFLYQLYIPRIAAFGCFDDCFNYLGGYFILNGKQLYSQIFFNHQPLMAYISYLIQLFTQPTNIFELLLRHRQFVLLFSFTANLLLLLRFGFFGIGFVFLYELLKFYLFGERFLGEGLIVYPLAYLVGIVIYKYQNKKIYKVDYIVSAICSWFIIFTRIPYLFATLASFGLIIGKPDIKFKKIVIAFFLALILLTIFVFPVQEYVFNIYTFNTHFFTVDGNILKSFIYPLYIFVRGEWNIFRQTLVILSGVFMILLLITVKQKQYKAALALLTILGLANIRLVEPGDVFYGAFHMVPWFGVFLFSIFLMLKNQLQLQNYKITTLLTIILIGLLSYILISPRSYIHEQLNQHEMLVNNFGNEMQAGEVVKVLSNSDDTLFLDGFDDLIYWQAQRLSPYKYSWYTSAMPNFPKYSNARLRMFKDNPPDFYYGSCPDARIALGSLPKDILNEYQQLFTTDDKPTCIYVHKQKLPEITDKQWKQAKELLYKQP